MRHPAIVVSCLVAVAQPVLAQDHDHVHSPYADQEQSGIASLSLQELQDLRNGAGMGLARAGELNHYPGPLHALELADSLELTTEQRDRVTGIRQAMVERATELGERIIEAERNLSRRFEHGHIDSASLAEATTELGRLGGELRYVHLVAHLAMKEVLTPAQVATYDRLRGYVREP